MRLSAHDEERATKAVEVLRKKIESEKDASREAERDLFAAMARRSELQALLEGLHGREELLTREVVQFKQELDEAGALIGANALKYESMLSALEEEKRAVQEDRRRKLERLKIRLEEAGTGGGSDILERASGNKRARRISCPGASRPQEYRREATKAHRGAHDNTPKPFWRRD